VSNTDGGEIHVKLRIDTSQVTEDLAAVDPEVQRLQQRIVALANRSAAVRAGRRAPAERLGDIPNVEMSRPAMRALTGQLDRRVEQLSRAARQGATTPPATPAAAARQQATARLDALRASRLPQQIDAPNSFFDKLARASARARPATSLYAAAGGRIPGAARQGMGAASLALELAGENPALAALMLGGGATIGAAFAVNQSQTSFQRQQAALSSSLIGGPLLGQQRGALGLAVANIGNSLSMGNDQAQKLVQGLAGSGMRPGDLQNNLRNTIQLAGPNQLDYGAIGGLTSSLATSGGLSSGQINRVFQDVGNVAGPAGVSIAQLVQSMQALSTNAAGAARDVIGLASVQHAIGASSGIVAGQLLAPVLGSTGGQALQQAALLGMTPAQLLSAQTSRGGTARIYDRIASLVRRVDRGPAGTDVAEQLLTSSGLVDPSAVHGPGGFAGMIAAMAAGSPHGAQNYASSLGRQADAAAVSQQQSYQKAAESLRNLTPAADRLGLAFENLFINATNGTSPANVVPPRRPRPGEVQSTPVEGGTVAGPGPLPGEVVAIPGKMMIPNGLGNYNQLPNQYRPLYAAGARDLARRTGISQTAALGILLAQGSAESSFNPNATSSAGAQGIAQFMPATARQYGLANPFDPAQAIMAQSRMDAANFAKSGHNWQKALGAYNPGDPTYGRQVYGAAGETQRNIEVMVHVTDDRVHVTQRPVTGSRTHGPTTPRRRG